MADSYYALRTVLITIGAIILGVGFYLLYAALIMVNYMAYYHCMGMMCGAMVYYPLLLPTIMITIGALAVAIPLAFMRAGKVVAQAGPADTNAGLINYYGNVLKLLPKGEREVLQYLIKNGGEAQQYQIARDLGLTKVQAWRIVHRLEAKGLVEVVKVKGRNIVRLRNFNNSN